jgi:signal transduction histidine kinase/ActR/RegA family two-component response regulator
MGLVSNELTEAFARGPDGKLYFGSVRGVTVVETDSKAESAFTPPVVITSLEVMGSPREPERTDDGSLAPLILDYGESFFSVEFAALDYSSPEQNSYAYMLEGFDDEWLQAGSRHFASYTNLDPGTYTLRIKGAGSRGNWNEEALTLPVTVRPPWWQTPFAYVGYVVALAAALFLIVRRLRRQGARAEARLAEQERINRELDHKVRERTAEIERSRAAAERANYEKSLFLANMSHEIRTPLNGLVGMLSLLSQTELEERQREYLRYSRVSAENLNTLVNDLLDFERIEAGELRLTREPFSITETAQYIDRLFGESARDKDLYLEVSVDLDGCPESVRSDRGRFVQVLTNLVGNAVKYTEHGGIRVRITARDPEGAEQVAGGAKVGTTTNDHEPGCRDLVLYRIEVSDTGKGIPPESQKGIFDRFRQLDNGYTKAARGVGLGLSIVKQVVDTMGGTVDVESEPGRGSTFRVEVPLEPALPGEQTGHGDDGTQPDAAAAEAQPAQEHGGGTDTTPHAERAGEAAGSDARRTSILVCEDEAINRLYLVQHLRREGYEVEVANDGEESVRKVEEGDYDLVLMDLGMPGISGLEAARRIRSWEQKHERVAVPVIALTAHTYEEDIRECRDAGMNGFVSKPINEAQLRRTLTDWLG